MTVHPALDYFVRAAALLADGDVDAAAKMSAAAEESLRETPVPNPATHAALVKAHAAVHKLALSQSSALNGEIKNSSNARRAVAHYAS